MLHHSLIHFLMIQWLSNNLRQPPGFFFCLGVRFLFFLTFYCKKASFLACIFPKLLFFSIAYCLFCFQAVKFQIWDCLLPQTYYVVCFHITLTLLLGNYSKFRTHSYSRIIIDMVTVIALYFFYLSATIF